jgi:hypothetical protein
LCVKVRFADGGVTPQSPTFCYSPIPLDSFYRFIFPRVTDKCMGEKRNRMQNVGYLVDMAANIFIALNIAYNYIFSVHHLCIFSFIYCSFSLVCYLGDLDVNERVIQSES